ncbi:MAG: SDR family NAD(P)-dependent oxidoreductase [Candidatus Heimdallarchaeota archaeon]|nr:SDR family NAD(P)-dependent oxidoreductase [Candidatus Heimdallarchaeota archaeon]
MAKKILVTGGCGFIGSNIVQRLISEGYQVKIIDDLSTGRREYIKECLAKKDICHFVKGTITDQKFIEEETKNIDMIIHEAANPNVRTSVEKLFSDFKINVLGTLNILHAMVKNDIPKIIFASSSGTVYGETEVIPTPENHLLAPISHYGASKAASEQYLSSFSSLYNIEAISLRLGNIFGPPSNHGVMYDFFCKLKQNPKKLEILGDGKQLKSYLYVDDCVDAHMQAMKFSFDGFQAFNITTSEGMTVNEIANYIIEAMGLTNVEFSYTGGERGWVGDVKRAISDVSKAEKELQWKQKITTKEGIKKYISWLENYT